MNEEELRINIPKFRDIKNYFLNNNFVLAFSLLTFFSIIIGILSTLSLPNIKIIGPLIRLFTPMLWFLFALSSIISTILAHYKKYSLMFIPIIVWLLITTAFVRTQNIPYLKNIATGEWTLGPDLDPFLYLRLAEEINAGNYSEIDYMRRAPLGTDNYAKNNLMPWAIVLVFKIISLFGKSSLTYAAIIAPVIFFLISIIGFFFFVYVLFSLVTSKNKALTGATIASFLYAFNPQMLHRTTAGIPEIESLGLVWFWFALAFFVLAWKQEKNEKILIYGLLSGLFTGIMSFSWGGYRYLYIIFSLITFFCFFFNIQHKKNFMIFTSFSLIGLIFELIKFRGINPILFSIIGPGISIFILFIIWIDFILMKIDFKISKRIKEKINLPPKIFNLLISIILCFSFLTLLNSKYVLNLTSKIIESFLTPFGTARISLTVAENKHPYFLEVLESFGYLTWFFLLGVLISFYEATKRFDNKKRIIFNLFFALFLFSLAFSRFSPTYPLLNGETALSKIIYFGGFITFLLLVSYIYIRSLVKKDEKTLTDFSEINIAYLIILSISFLSIISMRGAIRLFFIIAPFLTLISTFFIIKIFEYSKRKIELVKNLMWVLIFIVMLFVIIIFTSYASVTIYSAKYAAPNRYTYQWQYAMDWVNKNTPPGSIFVHWWDYGYWVQSLGKRPTVTDGGHAEEWWDHTTARYLLTTNRPETALSLMKTHNVSYLLIDSTDIGKYTAFSSIGSDKTGLDRLSWIPIFVLDSTKTLEYDNKIRMIYTGGSPLDADILYEELKEEKRVFLPREKTIFAAIILEYSQHNSTNFFFNQPYGVFLYNNKEYRIPIRYIYYKEKVFDFGLGLNSLLRIVPSLSPKNNNISINEVGAIIYLSEKTKDTLFSKLYLLNDINNEYPTLRVVHIEDDLLIKKLKQNGINIGEFVYYNGLIGPIKIWGVEYPIGIIKRNEFLYRPEGWNSLTGPWGILDNLEFRENTTNS
ncbi:MAG: STT3 domain-containing protein [Candidatus Pacearchaeota archaeon]